MSALSSRFADTDAASLGYTVRPPALLPLARSAVERSLVCKEFVSSKVSGETASLTNPAPDRLLDFAAEAGLVVLIHRDVDVPIYLVQMSDPLKRHQNVSIIWAHCGVGRIIHPIKGHAAMLEAILSDPAMKTSILTSLGTKSPNTSFPPQRVFGLART
jgi:predicted TIM-barrel fold metal-dependent hydrolase